MNEGLIQHFVFYFKRMVKFYELRVQPVPQILFVLLLTVSFGFKILQQPLTTDSMIYQQQVISIYQEGLSADLLTNTTSLEALQKIVFSEEYTQLMGIAVKLLGIWIIQQILMMLLAYFYLGAYLTDLASQSSSFTQYMKKYLKALPRYIGFNLLFYLAVLMLIMFCALLSSLLITLMPMMIFVVTVGLFLIQVVFIFRDITFLDTGVGVIKNFHLSWKLSSGNQRMIAMNIFIPLFLNMLLKSVMTGSNVLISLFVTSFLEVIALLILQRLIVLMYLRRTRVEKQKAVDD